MFRVTALELKNKAVKKFKKYIFAYYTEAERLTKLKRDLCYLNYY